MLNKKSHYDYEFYTGHRKGMLESARHVLEILYGIYKPHSVLDLGCGQGAWLSIAEALGSQSLVGIDGPWIEKADLLSNAILFKCVDLQYDIPILTQRFDLAITLEVAEHIAAERAGDFVELLCNASDVVLFSAAIPYQGGTNHINEKWPSYWIKIFAQHDFVCSDFIRQQIWSNREVEWWYRQNILLFVKKESDHYPLFFDAISHSPMINDIVHPDLFLMKMSANENAINKPTLRFLLSVVKNYLYSAIR